MDFSAGNLVAGWKHNRSKEACREMHHRLVLWEKIPLSPFMLLLNNVILIRYMYLFNFGYNIKFIFKIFIGKNECFAWCYVPASLKN